MVKKSVIIIAVVVAIAAIGYFVFFGGGPSGGGVVLENPTNGLTFEEAVQQFDEDFVIFLLYAIGANELHNPPFSSNEPQIQFYIGDEAYAAVVRGGGIGVAKGFIDEHDIVIRASTEEAVKMVQNPGYVTESFNSGASGIELIAGKPELLVKGYLGLYDKLKG